MYDQHHTSRDSRERETPHLLSVAVLPASGQPLTVYGDGSQTRSFQYISDLVAGIIAVMEGPHVGPFNVGNPGEFTMMELVSVGCFPLGAWALILLYCPELTGQARQGGGQPQRRDSLPREHG